LIQAALFVLGLSVLLVISAQAVSVATGKFDALAMDTTGPRLIRTGLSHIRVLKIYVHLPKSPVAEITSTSDQIQGDMPGAFIYQGKWQKGLVINLDGSFVTNNPLFLRRGATFYWEAFGD